MSGVYVGGTFDLPHHGHILFLQHAALHGPVTVSLNTDDFAARYKRRPVLSLEERALIVGELRSVHRVIINEGCEDSRPAILASDCRLIVHGDDWTGPVYLRQLGVTEHWLSRNSIRLVYVPYTAGVSTSEIIRRIRCG